MAQDLKAFERNAQPVPGGPVQHVFCVDCPYEMIVQICALWEGSQEQPKPNRIIPKGVVSLLNSRRSFGPCQRRQGRQRQGSRYENGRNGASHGGTMPTAHAPDKTFSDRYKLCNRPFSDFAFQSEESVHDRDTGTRNIGLPRLGSGFEQARPSHVYTLRKGEGQIGTVLQGR